MSALCRIAIIVICCYYACLSHAAPKRAAKAPTPAAAPETTIGAQLKAEQATQEPKSELQWYDATLLTMEGKGFQDTPTTYSRLPARAQNQVTSTVWFLSKNTAGLCIRFATDSTTIGASWDGGKGMSHMARTGSSGLDLYARQGDEWVFVGVGKPNETSRTMATLSRGARPAGISEYMLYLPLYDAVSELKIGVAPESFLAPMTPRKDKPIVFYGTSITQGGCASRAGMCHTAILGRWLNRPVINLGFSGSGKSEPEMAALVSEIDAQCFVLEPLPNMTVPQVTERLPGFVKTLRKRHPSAPILLVENPLFSTTATQNLALKGVYEQLKKQGVRRLHYLYGEPQLAGRENGTVDGVHPTDLGFLRMAQVYEPMLKVMVNEK